MTENRPEIKVLADLSALSEYAAEVFAATATRAVEERGSFCVCLSGGSTPGQTYALLSGRRFRSRIPWQDVHFFWGDERCVPTNHPDSLYGMVRKLMLSKAPIPPDNVRRMRGEANNPADAAAEYEEMLREFFQLKAHEKPRFDLILLGMGADGHTASLFPGTAALEERRRLVIPNYVPALKVNRLTLTLPVLNNAALVMFLVAGESKAAALRSIFHNTGEEKRLPAAMIDPPNGRALWLVDRAAATTWVRNGSDSSNVLELI